MQFVLQIKNEIKYLVHVYTSSSTFGISGAVVFARDEA